MIRTLVQWIVLILAVILVGAVATWIVDLIVHTFCWIAAVIYNGLKAT